VGIAWPPKGISSLSVYSVPLLNVIKNYKLPHQ